MQNESLCSAKKTQHENDKREKIVRRDVNDNFYLFHH